MNTRCTLVITQREAFGRSLESLRSVLENTPAPFDLVYVDGASPPGVQLALQEMARVHGFRLIREERFLPPNEAKCLALPWITTDYAVFLDNDVLVHPGWLTALVRCADETQAGAVAPLYLERLPGREEKLHMLGGQCRIVGPEAQRRLVVTHDQRKTGLPQDPASRLRTEHLEMHGFLVRSRLLTEHDLFDPEIPTIPENADFCLTLLAAGEQIWIEPQARITVLLPESVAPEDRPFFTTRWSNAWIESGFDRFSKKWRLGGPQPVLASQRRWAVSHRVIAYPGSLHRWLRVKSDSILNRRLLAPLESRWLNR